MCYKKKEGSAVGGTINLPDVGSPLRPFMGCGYGLHQASVGQITWLYPCRRLQMIDNPRATYYCNPACTSDTTNEEMKTLTLNNKGIMNHNTGQQS